MTKTVLSESPRLAVGVPLGPYPARPTTVQLFRFSAVTWNAHRIHYDREYAETEGYPGVLVQAHLHGCYLANAALDWAGPGGRLCSFRWTNRSIAVAGDELTVTGQVSSVSQDGDSTLVGLQLEEHDAQGTLCVSGEAVVAIPMSAPVDHR